MQNGEESLCQRKNRPRTGITAKYAANIRQMRDSFRKGRRSPYLQSLFPFKRCRKSGGNGYKPDDEFSNAAAFRRREEMAERQMYDKCPEVADTAREIYNVCFPYAERNAMKKQLIINTLSFEVCIQRFMTGMGYGNG